MEINLFNWYGNGDLLIVHEFVKELMEALSDTKITFAHAKSSRMFSDIPELEYGKLGPAYDNAKFVYQVGDIMYVNTWIGREGKYVTPANSNSVVNVQRLFNDAFKGIHTFEKTPLEYLPNVNYSYFEIDGVNNFVEQFRTQEKKTALVLISTGPVQSNQAENFDWTYAVGMLCDLYANNLSFITTDKMPFERKNLYCTADITKTSDGWDLQEIGYLSLFCNPIIGRSSGPYCFALTKPNTIDNPKSFICFTYRPEAVHYATGIETPACKKYWSAAVNPMDVYDVIVKILGKI